MQNNAQHQLFAPRSQVAQADEEYLRVAQAIRRILNNIPHMGYESQALAAMENGLREVERLAQTHRFVRQEHTPERPRHFISRGT